MIKFYKPLSVNECGKRENNEDCIYPKVGMATENDRLFIVCDGVGGANKGEVASGLLCEGIAAYFKLNFNTPVSEGYIKDAIRYAENKMTQQILSHPECKGMASTLTMLYINEMQIFLAWAGDSRIYHIRNGKILFKTKDHSLVNRLIEQGEITEEEAKTHPKKNVILKAVTGQDEPVEPDIVEITDIQPGDYFFLCSDGILESIDDSLLCTLLNGKNVLENIGNKIVQHCRINSRDNYSTYLIQIKTRI